MPALPPHQAQPNDPNVPPGSPTVTDVVEPMEQLSIAEHFNLIPYARAAAEAPPWFQAGIQQLRNDIHNDLQQLRNEFRQFRSEFQQDAQRDFRQYHNHQLAQKIQADILNDVRTMMRTEYLPDLKRLMNHNRDDGACGVPYEVVPFTNGDDPTQPPHNLPPLHSVYVIKSLDNQQLSAYLTGYGTSPLQVPDDRQKWTLGRYIGCKPEVLTEVEPW